MNLSTLKRGTKGCFIQLSEFQIVFEYSTSTPKIHLFVESFRLEESSERPDPPETVEILNREHILRQARQLLEMINGQTEPDEKDGYMSDGSIRSQGKGTFYPSNNGMDQSHTGDSDELFATQVHSVQHHELPSALPRSPRGRRPLGNELLGYLESHARPAKETTQPEGADSQDGPVNDQDRAISMETLPNAGPLPANGSPLSAQDTHNIETLIPLPSQKLPPSNNSPARHSLAKPSPVRPFPSRHSPERHSPMRHSPAADRPVPQTSRTTVFAQLGKDSVDSESVSRTKSDQKRKDDAIGQNESSGKSDKRLEGNDSRPDGNSKGRKQVPPRVKSQWDPSDPWKGMTSIRRRDIRIREDQLKLLESPHCWVPPEPGMQMPHCHVPPLLLQQWNDAISRKKYSSEEKPEKGSPEDTEPALPVGSSSAMHSESESEEETEIYPWSSSPPNRDPRNLAVPADSSPLQRNYLDKKPDADPAENNNTSASNHDPRPQDSVPETVSRTTEGITLETDDYITLPTQQPEPVDVASDDSDMDISVPHPLDAGSQQEQPHSQEEEGPTSSGPPLPNSKSVNKIQVVGTPAPRPKRLDGDNADREKPASQQGSPQALNTSSHSRMMNTYDSSGHLREDQSGKMQNSPVCSVAEDSEPRRTDNATTEDHDNLSQAEEAMVNSQILSDLNLYSQPTTLESSAQSMSQAPSVTQEQTTSQPFDQSQVVPESRLNNEAGFHAIHNSASGSSADNPTNVSTVGALKRSGDEMEMEEQPSPKRYRPSQNPDAVSVSNRQETSVEITVTRRQTFMNRATKFATAQEVYDYFRYTYPSYQGDFTHFTKMCAKLQALRARGLMQRSFLYDDFVIRHLLDYPHYLEQCVASVEEPQQYENYFCFNFLKPSYKKRVLGAAEVEISAAQAPTVGASFSGSPSIVRTESNTSFTGSLVNRLSKLHTFSPPSAPPKDTVNQDRVSTSISAAQQKTDDGPAPQERAEDPYGRPVENEVPPSPSVHDTENEADATSSHGHETDDDGGETTDKYHETASIELGDLEDTPRPTTRLTPGNHAETSVDNEGQDERLSNFPQLHPPREPVWSDSPNTPFKVWARADQNLLIERRRRGGAFMPTDEKGVIRPPIYPRREWEGGMSTLGWTWGSKDHS